MEDIRDDIQVAPQNLFTEPGFLKKLQEALTPGLEAAVSKALELQDAKLAALEQELQTTKDSQVRSQEELVPATLAAIYRYSYTFPCVLSPFDLFPCFPSSVPPCAPLLTPARSAERPTDGAVMV